MNQSKYCRNANFTQFFTDAFVIKLANNSNYLNKLVRAIIFIMYRKHKIILFQIDRSSRTAQCPRLGRASGRDCLFARLFL